MPLVVLALFHQSRWKFELSNKGNSARTTSLVQPFSRLEVDKNENNRFDGGWKENKWHAATRTALAHTYTNTSKQNKFRENLKMSDFAEDPNLTHAGSCLNYIRREGEGERWVEGQARTTKWYSSVAE